MPVQLRVPRLVCVGSDFSGLDTGIFALKRLQLPVEVSFCSDTDPHCRKLLEAAHKPKCFFDDAEQRKPEDEIPVDVYISTPPCQPWSSQGKRKGLQDPRGRLLKVPLRYTKRHKPRVFLMENVKGLCHRKNKPVLRGIRATLEKLDYRVWLGVLNAVDFQIPQKRQRLFIVAIRKDSCRRPFKWPKKLGKRRLSEALDPMQAADRPGRLPKNQRAKALALAACRKVNKEGIDPRQVPVAIDVGCSQKYATFGIDVSRTLSQARAKTGGFWISSRGRYMTTNEMLKVSGFQSSEMPDWNQHVSKTQLQGMLGNCVPIPLVGCVLQNALYAAGLISKLAPFPV